MPSTGRRGKRGGLRQIPQPAPVRANGSRVARIKRSESGINKVARIKRSESGINKVAWIKRSESGDEQSSPD